MRVFRQAGEKQYTKVLGSSIKGKVKKKNFSGGWNFSTFAAHLIEQDLF
jgi:hypothetical protein